MLVPTEWCVEAEFRGHHSKGGSQTLLSEGDKAAKADDSYIWDQLDFGDKDLFWSSEESDRNERQTITHWASLRNCWFCHFIELFI